MENNRQEQREALEVLMGFNDRLVGNMRTITGELLNGRKEDTDKFLKDIMDSVNWEIGVMNGTLSMINEGKVRIDKEQFNQKLMEFSRKIQAEGDKEKVEAVQILIPAFEKLGDAIKEILAE